jgi:hypothetical protein
LENAQVNPVVINVQTSPFTGVPGVRFDNTVSQPVDSIVFSGGQGNPNASGFIQGFMRPGGTTADAKPVGLLPSFLFNYTGGTQKLGDVSVNLTPGETNTVAKYPQFFASLSAMYSKYGIILVPLTFVAILFLAKRLIK